MKFRLVGQIHVYSIENWILVSYQAPKQRARSCQKDMVQCQKNTVVKLKVAAGYCRMVFQFFHGRVGSQYDHRYLSSSIELWEGGLCCVVAHVSVLVELLLAWFWKGSTPERNVLKHGFFTLVSLSLSPSPSVFHPCITRRFRKHVQTCWGLDFHPFSGHKSYLCWVKR